VNPLLAISPEAAARLCGVGVEQLAEVARVADEPTAYVQPKDGQRPWPCPHIGAIGYATCDSCLSFVDCLDPACAHPACGRDRCYAWLEAWRDVVGEGGEDVRVATGRPQPYWRSKPLRDDDLAKVREKGLDERALAKLERGWWRPRDVESGPSEALAVAVVAMVDGVTVQRREVKECAPAALGFAAHYGLPWRGGLILLEYRLAPSAARRSGTRGRRR
jgi:hypothetical protein